MVEGTQDCESNEQPATEQVHFCRTYIRPPMPKDENDILAEYERSSPFARACVKLFLLAIVVFVGFSIVKPFGVPLAVGVTVGCFAATAASLHWLTAPWRLNRRLERERVCEVPPVGSRLHCVGAPSDLPQAIPLKSVPFESQVYRASTMSQIVMKTISLLALAPAVGNSGILSGHYGWQTLFAAVLVAVALIVCARPLYFRIAPGRLEVLRYGFLKRNPVEVQRYDLRQSYIVADLRMNRVTVSEGDNKGKNYSLMLMRQRGEFLSTLFMAAVSEYNAPELPLDTL